MLTLLNAEHALIATDQLVYTAEETTALLDMLSRSEQVSRQAENMNSEMEKSFEATRTEGFQAGFAEGRAKATEELSKQLAVLHEKTEHQSDQIRQQCIDLALEIVRRIGLATGSPQTMADLATHAAAELLPGQSAVLRVPLDDAPAVASLISNEETGTRSIEVKGDAALGPGECVLDTDSGSLHAGLETQLQVMGRSLASRVDSDVITS